MPDTLADTPPAESAAPQPGPYRVTTSEMLSQDVISAVGIHVDDSSPAPVAVFRNPFSPAPDGTARHEALVISKTSGVTALLHVMPDPGSPTGWRSAEPFSSFSPTEVVAVAWTNAEGRKIVECFFLSGGLAYRSWLKDDGTTWAAPRRESNVSSLHDLKLSYADDGYLGSSMQPVVTVGGGLGGLILFPELRPVLTRFDANSQVTHCGVDHWVSAVVIDGRLHSNHGKLRQATVHGDTLTNYPDRVRRVVAGFGHHRGAVFLVLNEDGTLGMWGCDQRGSGQGSQKLGPFPFRTVTAHVSSLGQERTVPWDLYGIDENDRLWGVRQDPDRTFNDDGTRRWLPPVPLDSGLSGVATSADPADTPTLFCWTKGQRGLRLETQDINTGMWRETPVRVPQSATYQLTHYLVETSVTDKSGAPVAGLPVTLRCAENASACPVTLDNRQVAIDRTGTQLVTDVHGKLRFAVAPNGLGTSRLELTGEGIDRVPIQPGLAVHTYLSGKGTLRETDAQGPLPPFKADGNALRTATKREGGPLAPKASDETLASIAAQAIRHTALVGLNNPLTEAALAFRVTLPSGATAGVASNGHRFLLLKTQQEVDKHLEELRQSGGGAASYWWGPDAYNWVKDKCNQVVDKTKELAEKARRKFRQYGGDVLRGVKSGLIKLEDAVINGTKQLAEVVIKIGNQIVAGLKIAMHGLEQAAHFVVAVFHKIEAFVEKVIEWLRALFDLPAIRRTALALEDLFDKVVPIGRNGLTKAATEGKQWLSEQKANVPAAIDTLADHFKGRKVGQITGGESGSGLRSNQHATWLWHKVASTDKGPSHDGAGQQDPWADCLQQLKGAGTEFEKAIEDFAKGIGKAMTDPDEFTSQALPDLLQGVKHLAKAGLDLCEAVLDALVGLVKMALDALNTILTSSIDLEFISSVWEFVTGSKGPNIKISTVLAWVLAFPVTIGYKLTRGSNREPFPDGLPKHLFPSALVANEEETAHVALKELQTLAALTQVISLIPAWSSDALGPQTPKFIKTAGNVMTLVSASLAFGPKLNATLKEEPALAFINPVTQAASVLPALYLLSGPWSGPAHDEFRDYGIPVIKTVSALVALAYIATKRAADPGMNDTKLTAALLGTLPGLSSMLNLKKFQQSAARPYLAVAKITLDTAGLGVGSALVIGTL